MSGECQTKNRNEYGKDDEEKPIIALDEGNRLVSILKVEELFFQIILSVTLIKKPESHFKNQVTLHY